MNETFKGILKKGLKRVMNTITVTNGLTLGTLCQIVGLDLPQGFRADLQLSKVYAHPEHCEPDSAVFVTYYGNDKGHCKLALDRGAAVVFVRESCKNEHFMEEAKVIGVDDPVRYTTAYLKYLRSAIDAKVVTVTGSVGKTTTVDMLKCVLGDFYKLHSHHSMTNSRDGILRTIQKIQDDAEVYLQEVGAAEPGYVEGSAKGLCPDVAVITNIGGSHLDLYKTLDNILKDKASLVENMTEDGVAFFDLDNPTLSQYQTERKICWYSLNNREADYFADNISVVNNEQYFDIVCKETGESYPAKLSILGDYNIKNALAAFGVGRHLGIPEELMIQSLSKFRASGIRQNLCNIGGYNMLVDCFNSSPESFIGAVKTLESATVEKGGRRIVIMGEIAHLGKDAAEIYRQIGERLAECKFDICYCLGKDTVYTYLRAIELGVTNIHHTVDQEVLNKWIKTNVTTKDITLYKSSQLVGKLASTIDAVYGTVFWHSTQRVPVSYEKVSGVFKYIGDDLEFSKLDDNECRHLVIPGEMSGKKLRRISANAFSKHRQLEKVEIPDSVVNIGEGAFYVCTKLSSVKFPKKLRIIEDNAFNYCRALKRVVLPRGTLHIGRRAFYDCHQLSTITIPATVGFIGEDALKGCDNVVVKVAEGSYAQKYCIENSIAWEVIG